MVKFDHSPGSQGILIPMEPYFQENGVTIYCGDCCEILPELGRLQVVVTDPPYGISDAARTGERGGQRDAGDNTYHKPSEWDKELTLPDLDAGVIAWFGHWRKRETVAAKYGHIAAEIVWAKDVHTGPPGPIVASQDERVWIFGKFKPLKFETSVWRERVIPTWGRKRHKNEKPLALMRRLVGLIPGEIIADPFCGSGSTLEAAILEGRKAIGIELDERYCEIAANRCRQKSLF